MTLRLIYLMEKVDHRADRTAWLSNCSVRESATPSDKRLRGGAPSSAATHLNLSASYGQASADETMHETFRAARLSRAAAIDPSTSMPRQPSSTTKTIKSWP